MLIIFYIFLHFSLIFQRNSHNSFVLYPSPNSEMQGQKYVSCRECCTTTKQNGVVTFTAPCSINSKTVGATPRKILNKIHKNMNKIAKTHMILKWYRTSEMEERKTDKITFFYFTGKVQQFTTSTTGLLKLFSLSNSVPNFSFY